MPGAVQKLSEKLAQEGMETVRYFESLSADAWSQPVYSHDETWTVREILVHIVQTERYIGRLMAWVREGHPGIGPDFDLDRFNHEKVREMVGLNPKELLVLFSKRRQETASWVQGLSDSDLDLPGRHPALGETSLGRMARLIYLHNQVHLRDIRRTIRIDPDA